MSKIRVAIWIGLIVLLAADRLPAGYVAINFKGTDLNAEWAISSGYIPPDTMGAVGPNHVVEALNGAFAVYDKSGTLQSRTQLHSFWNTAFANAGTAATTDSTFDPRILYDKASGRWYAVSADTGGGGSGRVLVAVTTGADPGAANWRGYTIDSSSADTHWADFPTVGINADGLYISSNMYPVAAGDVTVTMIGIPKTSLLAGNISGFKVQENIDANTTGYSVQPVVSMDNSSLPGTLLSAYNTSEGTEGELKASAIPSDFFTTGLIDASVGFIPVTIHSEPMDAASPGGILVDTGDTRFGSNVIEQNGHLWGVHTVGLDGRSALEWYDIDAVTRAVLQTGIISDPSLAFFFPSIAVNDFGDVVIGFSGSNAATSISSYFVGGTTSGGVTTFGSTTLIQAGTGTYERLDRIGGRNRWGDYSATVIDPNNERLFWTFQEYVDGNDNWAVGISQINMDPSSVPEPSSLALSVLGLGGAGLGAWKRRFGRK